MTGIIERDRRGLLLAVRHDDGGVLVDDQHRPAVVVEQRSPGGERRGQRLPRRFSTLCPGDLAGGGTGSGDAAQIRGRDRVQHPPAGRVRGHRPEYLTLIGQRRDVANALATISEDHRHIDQHPTRIVRGLPRRPPSEDRRSCPVSVVPLARSASNRAPTCDTTPTRSAETSTGGRARVACT